MRVITVNTRAVIGCLFAFLLLTNVIYSVHAVKMVRIDAGSDTPYKDNNGNTWLADTMNNGIGINNTYSGGDIANTQNDALFFTERTTEDRRNPLTYTINVDAGQYKCNLYFAELLPEAFGVRRRVFHVYVNSKRVITSLDIFREAGANKALVKTVECLPVNGTITISFGHFIGNPKISALEILYYELPPPSTPSRVAGMAVYYYDYNEQVLERMPIPFDRKPVIGVIETDPLFKEQDYTYFRNSKWCFQFATTFNFYLNIQTGGDYTFSTESNDGTILFCDGRQIFNYDGNHDMGIVVTGTANLAAGEHKCILYYYQSIHRSGFKISWKPPNAQNFALIPSNLMSYNPKELAPVISSLDKTSAAAGTRITITGFGFYQTAGDTQVLFGTVPGTQISIVDPKHIQVTVPGGVSGQVAVTVKTPVDTSNPLQFTYV